MGNNTKSSINKNLINNYEIKIFKRRRNKEEVYNRDNFFLHGGNNNGSLGCIDIGGGILGNDITTKIKNITINSNKNILLKVVEGEEMK